MLMLLLAIAAPANLVGLVALVFGLRGRSAGLLTVLAVLSMLGAATTTSLTVFEVLSLGKMEESALFAADEDASARIRSTTAEDSRIVAVSGAAASILPWLGSILCFVRARRVDD